MTLHRPAHAAVHTARPAGPRRSVLFLAFAFAVIADPVSSVAYAIEAALRALHGDLALLLPTMSLVVGLVVVVTANYWQLVRRFPKGGGAAAAAGRAFGPRWRFLPIGALVVDFVLTIGISISAASSAAIALFPSPAPARIPLALALVVLVAALTWFGHGGRLLFAVMTAVFVVVSVVVLVMGFTYPHSMGTAPKNTDSGRPAVLAVVLAFPVAMALATGVEAPSTGIAQLGQLDDAYRRRFGRGTLTLLVVIVGGLTLALTALAVRLHIGLPGSDSTQIAEIAHAAAGPGWLFGAFQLTRQLPRRPAGDDPFRPDRGEARAGGSQRSRRRLRGLHPRGQSAAGLAGPVPAGHAPGRRGALRALGAGRTAHRCRGRGGTRGALMPIDGRQRPDGIGRVTVQRNNFWPKQTLHSLGIPGMVQGKIHPRAAAGRRDRGDAERGVGHTGRRAFQPPAALCGRRRTDAAAAFGHRVGGEPCDHVAGARRPGRLGAVGTRGGGTVRQTGTASGAGCGPGHQPRCREAGGRADGSEPASVKACSALIRSCR